MNKFWVNDSCETVQACYTVYPVPVAAALWCGVPANQVAEELRLAVPIGQSTALSRATLQHPYLKCLEPRIRAIHAAIDAGELPTCREDGRKTDDHVAYARRHVYGLDLREWAKTLAPTERPVFLFDDIERTTHPSINADSFRALQADRDALATTLDKTKDQLQKLRQEKEELERITQSLQSIVEKMNMPGERSETTYLNIIGALMRLLLSKSPGGQPYSTFTSQHAIISVLLAHHEGKPGISARTLEEKFAAAKRSLAAA